MDIEDAPGSCRRTTVGKSGDLLTIESFRSSSDGTSRTHERQFAFSPIIVMDRKKSDGRARLVGSPRCSFARNGIE